MSKEPNGPIDRDAAERLLRGMPDDPADPLAALLYAAASPATYMELAREDEAVAAFRSARLASPQRPGRHVAAGRSFGKLFSLRVAVATIAVTGVGGVALAATTGTLPGPLGAGPTAAPTKSAPGVKDGKSAKPSAKPPPATGKPKGSPRTEASQAASLVGLCQAYTNGAKHEGTRHKLLGTPAFKPLVDAAGKPRDVATFCDKLLANQPQVTPSPGSEGDERGRQDDQERRKKNKDSGGPGLDLGVAL